MASPPWPRDPWRHQEKEWDLYRDHDARALLWQMRTGKTRSTVDVAFHRHHDRGDVDGLLVLAPNGVHVNWLRRQLPQHAWRGVPWRGYAWQASERRLPAMVQAERDLLAYRDGLAVLAVNSESLVHDDAAKVIARFLKGRRVMLVVDESHNFRTPGARRTKRMRALAPRCPVRRILTGTPVDNSPLAAFSQFQILQRGALGFDRFDEFEGHYAVYRQVKTQGGRVFPQLDRYQNLDELRARIGQWASVVLRSECEDMSELVRDERTVLLAPRQAEVYRSLVNDLIVELESSATVTGIEPGVRITKLQQVLSGFLIDDGGTVHELVPDAENPRLLALLDELSSFDGKAIVWCKFHEDIKRVTRALCTAGVGAVEYHGRIHSQRARQEAIDAFNGDSSVRVFVGQPAAGGSGLDLSAATLLLWYSHTFDLIERSQADERASAIGGGVVHLRDFVTPGSIDGYILGNHAAKRSVRDALAGPGLRDHLLEELRRQLTVVA